MATQDLKGWSLLTTRVLLALVFLWHGVPKAFDWGLASSKFVGMGFWGWLGPVVGLIEVIGAVLLLLGLWNKWTNIVLGIIIVVAVIFVQLPKGVTAGLERDLLLLAAHFALIAGGPGNWALRLWK